MSFYLSAFETVRPPYETEQEKGLAWLAEAHVRAEMNVRDDLCVEDFRDQVSKAISKYCCKKEKISKRGSFLSDFSHFNWDGMEVHRLNGFPNGMDFGHRSRLFSKFAEAVFDQLYPESFSAAPDDMIHVTCTGYCSPSAAQKLIALRGWEKKTRVTHAYHMGCMGAMPAIRIGSGFCLSGKGRVDIVHTEICTLHLNPLLHSPEDLVGQSLFADGCIKYTISAKPPSPSLKIAAQHEEIIPQSAETMRWECEPWGMRFSLSKKIPFLLAEFVKGFLLRFLSKTSFSWKGIQQKAHFALHPGGPKIIEQISKALNLSSQQVWLTEKILYNYGNMSSATLPHIWQQALVEEVFRPGTTIVSLAFGPGLCVSGMILQKE